jgi:hypothetical protein
VLSDSEISELFHFQIIGDILDMFWLSQHGACLTNKQTNKKYSADLFKVLVSSAIFNKIELCELLLTKLPSSSSVCSRQGKALNDLSECVGKRFYSIANRVVGTAFSRGQIDTHTKLHGPKKLHRLLKVHSHLVLGTLVMSPLTSLLVI